MTREEKAIEYTELGTDEKEITPEWVVKHFLPDYKNRATFHGVPFLNSKNIQKIIDEFFPEALENFAKKQREDAIIISTKILCNMFCTTDERIICGYTPSCNCVVEQFLSKYDDLKKQF